MKTLLLTLSFLSITFHQVFSQIVDEKRHFISLNIGVSNPLGDYASKSGDKAGYAAIGSNFNFEGAYYFKPYIGAGGMIGTFINKLDNDAFGKDFNNSLESSGLNGSYSGTVGNWSNFYGLIGPYLSLPLNKFTFDIKLLGGFSSTTEPAIDITIVPNSNPSPIRVVTKTVNGTAFGYCVGLGGRYHFSKRWAVKLNADFISSNPEMEQSSEITYQGQTTKNTNTYSQSVATININAGIVWHFVK